jgi:hypothetical protein
MDANDNWERSFVSPTTQRLACRAKPREGALWMVDGPPTPLETPQNTLIPPPFPHHSEGSQNYGMAHIMLNLQRKYPKSLFLHIGRDVAKVCIF